MSTERFIKTAGSHIAQGQDDPTMLLIGAGVPNWVQLPSQLGGARVNVDSSFNARCACNAGHRAVHMVLGEYTVAECPVRREFLFYRTPE